MIFPFKNMSSDISKKYEIRNANGIVVGYRSPTAKSERKAVIATAQSQTNYALAAVGASNTAWQREENAAASSMQRALSPPVAGDSPAAHQRTAALRSPAASASRQRSSSEPGDQTLVLGVLESSAADSPAAAAAPGRLAAPGTAVRIPALRLPGSLLDNATGAVSERVRRSARNRSFQKESHQQPHHHHHSQQQQQQSQHLRSARSPRVHSPRSAASQSSSTAARSPRSPRVMHSPRRRRGTVTRHTHAPRHDAAAVAANATASSEGGAAATTTTTTTTTATTTGASRGSVIVPASPRGLVKRVTSPRSHTRARATFDGLSDAILLRIFALLPTEDVVLRVSLVNFRCYQLCQDASVFKSVDLSRQTLSDEALVDLLCELGWSSLESLAPPSTLTSRGLHALATCRSLHCLHLRSNPKISSHLLQRVVEYAEWQLRTIDLSGIIVTDDVVMALADRFDHCLESISLVQMTPLAVTDRSISHLLRQCSALRHLSVRSCHSLTFDAFDEITSKELAAIDVADCAELDDRFLKRLAKYAPQLRSLVLSGLGRITDKPLIELLRACTQLRDLALAECALLSDALLTTLTRKCAFDLRSLDLVGLPLLTAPALVPFIEKQCAALQRFRISHSPAAVCEPALRALAKTCAPTLVFLDLRQGDNATTLGDDVLALLPHFKYLRHLDVSECGENVTAMLLGDVFAKLPWLQSLYADQCTGLTNQLVRKLTVALERDPFNAQGDGALALLDVISLIGCDNVSRDSLLDTIRASKPHCKATI